MNNEWNNELNNHKIENIKTIIELTNKYKKCKNCIFYTGVQCHGHGDFWGTCNLIEKIISEYEEEIDKYNDKQKNLENKILYYHSICYDETNCMFEKFIYKLKEAVKIE